MNTLDAPIWIVLAQARPVLLWTDLLLWALLIGGVLVAGRLRRDPLQRRAWRRVLATPGAPAALVVLAAMGTLAMLDSVHFRRALPSAAGAPTVQATQTESLLDLLLARPLAMRESGYSHPLDAWTLTRESVVRHGVVTREPQRLAHGGAHLIDPAAERGRDLVVRGVSGGLTGLLLALAGITAVSRQRPDRLRGPAREAAIAVAVLATLAGSVVAWAGAWHVLGTDRIGQDVLVQALKSVRTALVIGLLASLATVPPALALGLLAGWYRGAVDAAVQGVTAVLAAIPNVLLIAAGVLLAQAAIDARPQAFASALERADAKLLLLCLILGLGGWAGLCRLVRAETLRLRSLDFIRAARGSGLSDARIVWRHLAPHVAHLVLIQAALDLSMLVLYEAVLTYVGVGVDPALQSFGSMINLARSELLREPVVYGSVGAAFVFMVVLVLALNVLADAIRLAFDPRAALGGGRP
ncbi:ABC transporter permease [Sphaerotilus mobilis]|uniref:Peptide/nickel transport system permease protein n=1 Tax=Sphaerotilus mobilis TaxID=47994 RepID=A0A4Q7LR82_9BURK|nr:ABC transporter permease [Sphaerotilus mobilis]RZS56557.1 peptide/nickel transport system permease protein [Sphaerotilus mobilis]